MTITTDTLRELDHRVADGIDVRMLWDPTANRVVVAVSDFKTGEAFDIEVGEGESALEVFHHPFAYAAYRTTSVRVAVAAGDAA
jgi:hypothetical protein